jgi:phenylacetate-CoA ligase
VETKDGPTIWEDHFYPEIVDPATGKPVPDGQPGELVLTSLTKEAMPIIRYRTRDLTRLLPGTARSMRRMEKVTGRSDDMMILRGVNVFPSQIEEQILKCKGLAPHYVIELGRDGRLDTMTVQVEARPDAIDAAVRAQMVRELTHHVKAVIGVSVRVNVLDPNAIDRSVGKARRVMDMRPKD